LVFKLINIVRSATFMIERANFAKTSTVVNAITIGHILKVAHMAGPRCLLK
jgi:hypothetical protein